LAPPLLHKTRKHGPFSFARDKINIADELCAALASLQGNLAAMEGFQLGSVPYA
jgi:hypothetical protein